MTGLGRRLNNRHWPPDILAGAATGIFSSQLTYFSVDRIYGNKGDNLSLLSKIEGNDNPSFLGIKLGYARAFESLVQDDNGEPLDETGWEAGLEGAYFLNKNYGIGGQIMTVGFPIESINIAIPNTTNELTQPVDGEVLIESMGNLNFSISPYYATHLSEKWNLMFNVSTPFFPQLRLDFSNLRY